MSDLCSNYITITGKKEEDRLLLIELLEKGTLFSTFFKVPEELAKGPVILAKEGVFDTESERLSGLYGAHDILTWKLTNIGIMADGLEPDGGSISCTTDTANENWSCSFWCFTKNSVPITGLSKICKDKGLGVSHYYHAPHCALVGHAVDGVDTEFSYSIYDDPIVLEDRVGSELFELFNMSDWLTLED